MTPHSLQELVSQNYAHLHAPHWHAESAASRGHSARALIHALQCFLPPDPAARFLDLGCGAGLMLDALRLAGYKNSIGVDISSQAVAAARERGHTVVHDEITHFLRTSPDSWDCISLIDVIEHFSPDVSHELLRLIAARLSGLGLLILRTPNALSPWAAHYRYDDLSHKAMYTPNALAALLSLSGFRVHAILDASPYVHSPLSAARWILWKCIFLGLAVYNLAETGSTHGGIYTRNMFAVAQLASSA